MLSAPWQPSLLTRPQQHHRCHRHRRRQRCRQRCRPDVQAAGMHVPSESFGGVSPERRAAQSLQSFFTFVAARVVMSQLEGIGRGDLGSYNAEASRVLRHFLENEPLGDASAWLAQLTQENEMLGVRIMEVRAAYASEDFEWDNLQRLAVEGLAKDNVQILRKHASQRFTAMLQPQPPQQTVGEDLREQDM